MRMVSVQRKRTYFSLSLTLPSPQSFCVFFCAVVFPYSGCFALSLSLALALSLSRCLPLLFCGRLLWLFSLFFFSHSLVRPDFVSHLLRSTGKAGVLLESRMDVSEPRQSPKQPCHVADAASSLRQRVETSLAF